MSTTQILSVEGAIFYHLPTLELSYLTVIYWELYVLIPLISALPSFPILNPAKGV